MTTKSQIRALGERLGRGPPTVEDIHLLEEFRSSFDAAYQHVTTVLNALGYVATGRAAKTTASIAAKVARERTNLWKMQDIAGCRIVVNGPINQAYALLRISSALTVVRTDDRRSRPSNGYRAIHVIVEHGERCVEIQIRTGLQQAWAETCEKAADTIDPKVKYGQGPESVLALLNDASVLVARLEALQYEISLTRQAGGGVLDETQQAEVECQHLELDETARSMDRLMRSYRESWENQR